MKILIVKYLPSGENSNTLKLLEHFEQNIKGYHEVSELDLVKNPAPFFNELSLQAYKKRNFGGETLSPEEAESLRENDRLTDEFMEADLIVLATPMHNFSLPGMIKVYLDAIMQYGKLFTYENGASVGLMGAKKFLTIYSSMGTYNSEYGYLDNLKRVMKIELEFIGITNFEFIHAITGNATTREMHIEKTKKVIDELIEDWNL